MQKRTVRIIKSIIESIIVARIIHIIETDMIRTMITREIRNTIRKSIITRRIIITGIIMKDKGCGCIINS